jgi:iron complex outermembrane receptor protein
MIDTAKNADGPSAMRKRGHLPAGTPATNPRGLSGKRAAGLVLILTLCHAAPGQSGENDKPEVFRFDIPAEGMAAALEAFSETTDIQLICPSALVRDVKSKALSGTYTPEQALAKLLADSDITYRFADDQVIALAGSKNKGMSTESLLARAPKENYPADPTPEKPFTGSVEQEDMTVQGVALSGYSVIDASTATKTDTPIMETPVNIQVVPQQVLKDQQSIRIEQALQNTSGVYKKQAESAESFNIRGFATFDYYRDGVRNQSALTQTGDRETANLERIEVLKGPAAILYGRIEPGGMINLVTKQPLDQAYYSLQQQFGSFDLYRTTLDATGPVTENNELLYRFNLAYEDKGSFREFVNNDRIFIAPVVKWNISDRTQAIFEMEYKHAKETTDFGIPVRGNRPVDIPRERNLGESFAFSESDEVLLGFNWSHAFNDQWQIRHKFNAIFTEENDDTVIGASDVAANSNTFSRFYSGFRDNKTQSYVNSLDLTGHFDTFGLQHTALFGGDYYIFHNSGLIIADYNFPSIDILNPIHSGAPLRDPNNDFGMDTSEEWYGLYFQDQIKLPYNVHLLAGFRYDNARVTYHPSFAGITNTVHQSDDAITPRVGLLWQPIPEVSLYGNYVENFGVSNAFFTGANGADLEPETAQQWETGIKTAFFDGRLTTTLAWYQLTKQNIAISSSDPIAAARGESEQVGEVQNSGVELDIAGEILPGWNIIGSYSYIDSEITRQNDGTQGNRFHNVPRHGGSLWNTYQFQTGVLQGLKMGAGIVARGQREGNNENDFQMPGYALVNLMTGYEFKVGKSKVTAQLNVDNLLDKEYFPSSVGFGRSRVDVGAPRTFLGSIRVEY